MSLGFSRLLASPFLTFLSFSLSFLFLFTCGNFRRRGLSGPLRERAQRRAERGGAAPASLTSPPPGHTPRTHSHSHLWGKIKRARRPEVCFLRRSSPITTLLAGQWAPVSVLLAPVLYDAGNSISSWCWKINLDRAFPFLLRIRTHPGKPELPERGRSGRNRHPSVLSRLSPSR